MQRAVANRGEHRPQIEFSIMANLFQEIGAADGRLERRQSKLCQQSLKIFGKVEEETHHVLWLAAEFGAQLWPLCSDASGTGVEVTLPRHVTANRNQDGGAESKLISAEQSGDQDIAPGQQPAVDPQSHTPAQAVVPQHLLGFAQAQLPGISRVLDAAQRGCAGAAAVSGDVNVVRVGFRHACGDRTHAQLRDQLNPNRGARIDALQVVYQLSQIFDAVDIVMRRRTDQRNAWLRVAQARDQFADLVTGKLATFSGLRTLCNLDLQLFRVRQVFRSHTKAA